MCHVKNVALNGARMPETFGMDPMLQVETMCSESEHLEILFFTPVNSMLILGQYCTYLRISMRHLHDITCKATPDCYVSISQQQQ